MTPEETNWRQLHDDLKEVLDQYEVSLVACDGELQICYGVTPGLDAPVKYLLFDGTRFVPLGEIKP